MTAEILSWSIESSYIDARGHPQIIDPRAAEALAIFLARHGAAGDRGQHVAVLRAGEPKHVHIAAVASPLRWRLSDTHGVIAAGNADCPIVALPSDLQSGSYGLSVDASDNAQRDILVLIAPDMAYQPALFRNGACAWLLAVQLYAVRSSRNWGHGDFGDLARLLDIASKMGASGVGLNPLHALAPGQASAYSPSSRIFLNPLYIDVEAVNEFSGADACGLTEEVARLRSTDVVDYAAVHVAKRTALRAAYAVFQSRATPERRRDFAAFCDRHVTTLERFAIFEILHERFGKPWQAWPSEWQDVSRAMQRHRAGDLGDIGLPAFIQWIADQQLRACAQIAKSSGMPIGLYLDIAVGVDPSGADSWAAPRMLCQELSIGAPPDIYNPQGQNWGLASFHPQALIDTDFSLFRQVLRSAMQYAGAIRIDHALGLNRLFLIPVGSAAADGGYVRFPFAAMLAVIAQESINNWCLVIGEDLGTIPEGICEALNEWGIWSYRVAMFEREQDGTFRRPEHFPAKAIVTFSTHDLPTFEGWKSSHDLKVKAALCLDPGQTEEERQDSVNAMRATLHELGLPLELELELELELLDVLKYLAATRSGLLAVSTEDILGLFDQSNVPGTIDEHPNWRRRLPLSLEEFGNHEMLQNVADVMASTGRNCAKHSRRIDLP